MAYPRSKIAIIYCQIYQLKIFFPIVNFVVARLLTPDELIAYVCIATNYVIGHIFSSSSTN